MTAVQTTRSPNEMTDWTLLQYHNKCVARVANWADCCKSVMHLQVDGGSSLLATILKVACFVIATIGFLIYDVVNEAWRGSFPKNEISAEPPKAVEPAKEKAPPPTPKKHTPLKAVDGSIKAQLEALDNGLAESLQIADENTDKLDSIISDAKTIKTKVGQLEKSLSKIQGKLDGIAKQVTDAITPLISKASAKKVNFGSASVLPEGTPKNWKSKTQYPQTPNAKKTPLNPPPSSTPGSLADASFSQLSEMGESLLYSSDEEVNPLATSPISEANTEQTNTPIRRCAKKIRRALDEYSLELGNQSSHPANRTRHSRSDSTTSVDARKGNLFAADVSLTPIPQNKPQKSTFKTPDTNLVDISLTPVRNSMSSFSTPLRKTPVGVHPISLRPSAPQSLTSTPAKSSNSTTPHSVSRLKENPFPLNLDEEPMEFTPNYSTIAGQPSALSSSTAAKTPPGKPLVADAGDP